MIRRRIASAFSKVREAIVNAPLATNIFCATVVLVLGAKIPIPGVNTEVLSDFFTGGTNNQLLNLSDWLVGGALSRGALLALGIVPYFSARIFLRLASALSPALANIRRQPGGPERIARWAPRLTFVLALLQSLGFARFVQTIPGAVAMPGPVFVLQVVTVLTASAMTVSWLAERTRKASAGLSFDAAESADRPITQVEASNETRSLPAADIRGEPTFVREKVRVTDQ